MVQNINLFTLTYFNIPFHMVQCIINFYKQSFQAFFYLYTAKFLYQKQIQNLQNNCIFVLIFCLFLSMEQQIWLLFQNTIRQSVRTVTTLSHKLSTIYRTLFVLYIVTPRQKQKKLNRYHQLALRIKAGSCLWYLIFQQQTNFECL